MRKGSEPRLLDEKIDFKPAGGASVPEKCLKGRAISHQAVYVVCANDCRQGLTLSQFGSRDELRRPDLHRTVLPIRPPTIRDLHLQVPLTQYVASPYHPAEVAY